MCGRRMPGVIAGINGSIRREDKKIAEVQKSIGGRAEDNRIEFEEDDILVCPLQLQRIILI